MNVAELWRLLENSAMPPDLRDAIRSFTRNRGFVAAAVVSLALGVGANTAIFSVASALLLRPLPVAHPERLARV